MTEFKSFLGDDGEVNEEVGILNKLRHVEGFKKIRTSFNDAEPEIVILAGVMLKISKAKEIIKLFNETLNRLMDESEKLIDSPESNTPETKIKRKYIADQINILLEDQQNFEKDIGEIVGDENLLSMSSKEDISKAEAIVDAIMVEVKESLNPVSGLN